MENGFNKAIWRFLELVGYLRECSDDGQLHKLRPATNRYQDYGGGRIVQAEKRAEGRKHEAGAR